MSTIRLGDGDYEWADEPARPPGGGDGSLLPMSVPEWRRARDQSQQGRCANPACGGWIDPDNRWETGCKHTGIASTCSESCGDALYDRLDEIWRQRCRNKLCNPLWSQFLRRLAAS